MNETGAITGMARDVDENISAAAISPQMRLFLHKAYRQAFSLAGYQRRERSAEPGVWCDFDVVVWARELRIPQNRLWRLREQAITLNYIFYAPNDDNPKCGRIIWNLAFGEWITDKAGCSAVEDPKKEPRKRAEPPPEVLEWIEHLWAGEVDGGSERLSTATWMALRDRVFQRDRYTCVYCGAVGEPLHCDHIVPISRGGTNSPTNLTTACQQCNLRKWAHPLGEWRQ